MTQEDQQPEENRSEGHYPIRFSIDLAPTTDAALPMGQKNPMPIPRAFERLGAPVRLTEQARAYLLTLPLSGTNQVARAIGVAIDAGLPVTLVNLVVDLDREEGWDELAARLDVDQQSDEALRAWEEIEGRLYVARSNLSPEDRAKMEEGFALYLNWASPQDLSS